MEFRLGLSLLLLLTYFCSTQSKNTRDGPNLRPRHEKRATPSEFLKPPAPSGKFFNQVPSSNLAPPPLIPPLPASFRHGRFIGNSESANKDSRGYFSRFLHWINPWSTSDVVTPPPQSLNGPSGYIPEERRSGIKNGPFNPERSCNPCNDVPWVPIRGTVNEPSNLQAPSLHHDSGSGYRFPSPSHEIREPDFTYPPFPNAYPPPAFPNHPIPNPHIYPGAMPPLYKATQFSSAGNDQFYKSENKPGFDFQHRKQTGSDSPILDSKGDGTSLQENIQGHRESGIQVANHPEGPEVIQGQESQEQKIHVPSKEIKIHVPSQEIKIHVPSQDQKGRENQMIEGKGKDFGDKIQGQEYPFQEYKGFRILTREQLDNQSVEGQLLQKTQSSSNLEIIPSIGGQISSEQIHFEKSPIIDLSVSVGPSTPFTLTESLTTIDDERTVETSTKLSSLIDYIVSGYEDRIPIDENDGLGDTRSPVELKNLSDTVHGIGLRQPIESRVPIDSRHPIDSRQPIDLRQPIDSTESSEIDYYGQNYNQEEARYSENQPFLEALMNSYYKFKREEEAELRDSKASATNFGSSGTSGGDNWPISVPFNRTAKKNKQVQIIIPYTSQYTPSPFHSSFVNNENPGQKEVQMPRKVHSEIHFDPFEDSVIAQESNTVSVTSLPDVRSTSPIPSDAKNNSIDVQRLQKNIDNWTIQEYSKGMIASTVVPNSTHPYLSRSKKIPKEYFTTKQPTSDEIYDEDGKQVSSEFDFEDYKQMTTFEISRLTQEQKTTTPKYATSSEKSRETLNQVETKENEILASSREVLGKVELSKVHPVFPSTSINWKGEKVYVVTPLPISEKELKKAFDVELKKKPKKKESEKIERAYQVLPQAVNNLAVASTGPEIAPLWGIMEHEEFASSNSDSKLELPVLYTGHSKVSHARR